MSQITWADKVTLDAQPDIARINKVIDVDMNEIKSAHNDTDNKLTNLNTYSTTEQVIGTWLDGKPIYRQCVYVSAFPNASYMTINLSSSNIDYLINMYGSAKTVLDNKSYCTPINNARPGASEYTFGAFIDGGDLRIATAIDRTIYSGYIIIEYTKTTD